MDWLCDSLSTSDHGPVPLIAVIDLFPKDENRETEVSGFR